MRPRFHELASRIPTRSGVEAARKLTTSSRFPTSATLSHSPRRKMRIVALPFVAILLVSFGPESVTASAPAQAPAAVPPAKGADDPRPDDWKDVEFTKANFDEVRMQVKKRYRDPNIDERWAFAQAASLALASNPGRSLLLLPEVFYRARKDDAR